MPGGTISAGHGRLLTVLLDRMDTDMLHMIVNPAGAAGRTLRYFRQTVLPCFAGAQYQIHYSSRERGIGEIVSALTDPAARTEDEYVNLVVVGGDGTMNEVMNGIRDFEHTRIGLIPAGSGNDLARDLDLPRDVKKIADRIRKEETSRKADVGETIFHDSGTAQRFLVSSGAGFDAQACHMAQNAPMKGILNRLRLGKLIYIFEAMKLIFAWRCVPVSVTCDPEGEGDARTVFKIRKFVFIAAMNHRYEGGGFMMCPDAADDDGKLDYCLVHDLSVAGFFRFFPLAMTGAHVRHREIVSQLRRTGVRIRSKKPLWVHCDGEPTGPPPTWR